MTDTPADPQASSRLGKAGCDVHLLGPGAGAAIVAGGRLSGAGWIVSESPVTSIDVSLGEAHLCQARVVPSSRDFRTLTGRTPPDDAVGFVFASRVPGFGRAESDTDIALRLQIDTASGRHEHTCPLRLAPASSAPPIPSEPVASAPPPAKSLDAAANSDKRPPIRAVIEAARIDEHGILRVVGWAASLFAIEQLRVFVGERHLGDAQRDMRRDDVAAIHPDYPNAGNSGFLLRQEATAADLAEDAVHVAVIAQGGARKIFSVPLVRPAHLRRRPSEAMAKLNCDEVMLTEHGRFAVKGWAVCSSGVAEIEVELDGAPIGTTHAAEDRPDVGNRFPRLPSARQAGFRLGRDLDGRFAGEHVVRLTVRGQNGEESSISQTVAVSAVAEAGTPPDAARPDSSAENAIRFFLDSPAVKDDEAIETVRGFMSLNGWAFGRDKIERIEIFVDGQSQGRAHYGIRREDLQAAFPGTDALLAGFAMVIPPQVMKPGVHDLRVVARDTAGHTKEIAFSVRAEKAISGPGPWMPRTKMPQSEINLQHAILAANGHAPKWSIVLVAPQVTPAVVAGLTVTLRSLEFQAYEGWTLTILASTHAEAALLATALTATLDEANGKARIVVLRPEQALADAAGEGDFVAVLGAGDALGEDALLELSLETMLGGKADFLYSDERRIDPADGEVKAFFKPDFSPDLLLSTNYIGRLWAATPTLLRAADLRSGELATFGEFDAVLRLTERAGQVLHVPKVLCVRASGGDRGRGEPSMLERRALRRAMRRRKIRGDLLAGPVRGSYRLRRDIPADTQARGVVSVIIPTNATRGLIETAIRSIREHTAWPNYEIICLDNIPRDGDDQTSEQRRLKAWIGENADRVIESAGTFNWSRFNNIAARQARGDFLLFLNDDIEVLDPHWLHGLVEHAQRPEVGTVGPQLIYPDGRVQHAGVFLARHAARHAFRFYPRDEPGPFGLALTQRDVISVTGACLMVRREVFEELGGFDEKHAVVNNDLDFNLRVRGTGRSVVFTPAVCLVHHEMVSRSKLSDRYNTRHFDRAWGGLFLKGDPFFSRHFSPDYDDYLPDAEPVRVFNAGHPVLAQEKIRRILAIKVDHIGDFITAFPAFRRIKERFPGARLTVLAAKAPLALAPMEPAIDEVIEFNFFHPRSEKGRLTVGEKELAELALRLAPARFDLAIDLRRQSDTRPILQHTGARWLAGFERGYAHPWLDFSVEFEGDLAQHWKRSHVTDSLLTLVDAVAAQCEQDRRLIRDPLTRDEARLRVGDLLPAARPGQPLICIHTGAGALNKQWPAASFAGLIDLLAGGDAGHADATVALVGGAEVKQFARDVVRRTRRREAVIDLVGKTALADLPNILRAADLYVGNDSGPKHLAAALGVPTIGIHSGTVDAGEWGAMGPHTLTIRRDMTCSPCYLAHAADCHRGLACLDGIRVGDVFRACQRLLALSARHRAAIRSCGSSTEPDADLGHAAD